MTNVNNIGGSQSQHNPEVQINMSYTAEHEKFPWMYQDEVSVSTFCPTHSTHGSNLKLLSVFNWVAFHRTKLRYPWMLNNKT
jgi:hypothetical protein